ncbi:flagellar motor stator protein MotA [Paracoccus litorisediminis]|uniref:flagellar motor stator protein MotA n=1 Tax=Paracoccus litorisediminis TaxID=2006130 RepID=UPI003731266C
MMILIGLAIVFGMVFGGYILSGGSMAVMMHALPFEGMMVGGATLGAFVIANNIRVIKQSGGAFLTAFKGAHWKPSDYTDLLKLMYELAKTSKAGLQELEKHIEKPETSSIFAKYPRIAKNHEALDLIVDAFRMVTMNFDDPIETEDVINRKLEALRKHMHEPVHALTNVADGLPAIGIVAAVLGVIKTMAAVDEPPAILGAMIGGALVGTFLGVFLAYCLVAPVAQRVKQIEAQDETFGEVIRDVIVAIVKGHPPNVCVEIGRGNIPPAIRPRFAEVENQIRGS